MYEFNPDEHEPEGRTYSVSKAPFAFYYNGDQINAGSYKAMLRMAVGYSDGDGYWEVVYRATGTVIAQGFCNIDSWRPCPHHRERRVEDNPSEPWNCTNEEILNGKCDELVYMPTRFSPLTLASRFGNRSDSSGKIVIIGKTYVGDLFLQSPQDGRKLLLLHERGHDLAGAILADKTRPWEKIMEPLKTGRWAGGYYEYIHPYWPNSRPEEIIADVYMEIMTQGVPDYSDRSNYMAETERKLDPLYKRVVDAIMENEYYGPCHKRVVKW